MGNLIEDYAIIGDLHTAALVGTDGSIDWLCLPHFDSGACFAALLDTPEAGRWLVAPEGGGRCTRRSYRDDTLILHTEWETPDGVVEVIDCMPPRDDAVDVVRLVRGVRGSVRMSTELRLRFDYGHVRPWVRQIDGNLAAIAGPDAVWLSAPVPLRGVGEAAEGISGASFTVREGDTVPMVLTWQRSHLGYGRKVDPVAAVEDTETFWRDWISRCASTDPAVRRSLITLKALTYEPTGGIVAAATTSLPEQWGGPRNWDYRYCWLRDASFTLNALLENGYVEEARAWRDWLLRAAAGDPADLQIMYGLDGRRRIPEWEVPWLSGYEGASPVRVGNGAAPQFQLDVWGEVLDSLFVAHQRGLNNDAHAWGMQRALMEHLESRWREPDASLWEIRGEPRHFVHSKVLAWVAADRMVRMAEATGLEAPVDSWRAMRDEVHREVCERGFDAERNTFTQFYGSRGLDAALLLIPRLGFLPPDDPRVVGTVDAVMRELGQDGLILRYRNDVDDEGGTGLDGLTGDEGIFIACSFWLADALFMIGREQEAHALYERLLGLSNDVGLLSEEYDPVRGRQLGNTPQAYSHVALVNTAGLLRRS